MLRNHKERPGAPVVLAPLNKPYLENMEPTWRATARVDLVMCTHLHVDHGGWHNQWSTEVGATFQLARYF